MFKREKVGEDILFEMEKNLRRNAFIEDTQKTNERIEAMELLEKAANNFEAVGKISEAEAVTRIIEFVATKKAEKVEKIPTPEQQVENMKSTGTQFGLEMFEVEDGIIDDEEEAYLNEVNPPKVEFRVSEASDDLDSSELEELKNLWG